MFVLTIRLFDWLLRKLPVAPDPPDANFPPIRSEMSEETAIRPEDKPEDEQPTNWAADLTKILDDLVGQPAGGKSDQELIDSLDLSVAAETERLEAHRREFNDGMSRLMKTLQQKRLDEADVRPAAALVRALVLLAARRSFAEIFKHLSANKELLQNFNRVFELCRPLFRMRIPAEGGRRVNAAIHVLKRMLDDALEAGGPNDVKSVFLLMRQLTRSSTKTVGAEQIVSQLAVVSTTDLIVDVLFGLPLNAQNCEFILSLLGQMFGTGNENRVHFVNWEPKEGESWIKPSELLTFLLLVYKRQRREMPSRSALPQVFRNFGTKLLKEKVVIPADELLFVEHELNTWLWSTKYAVGRCFERAAADWEVEIPEVLFRYMRIDARRTLRKVQMAGGREAAPVDDFFIALLELAFASVDLARELLADLRPAVCFPDCDPATLRITFIDTLLSYRRQPVTADTYRSLVPFVDAVIRRFDWPLDLCAQMPRMTAMVNEIAIKNELLNVLGVVPMLSIAIEVQDGGDTAESKDAQVILASTSALATCFATESYKILSELYTSYVDDQTNTRSRQCHSSPAVVLALRKTLENVRLIANKMLQTPLKSTAIATCASGVDELLRRLAAAERTIGAGWSLEAEARRMAGATERAASNQ